MATTPPKSPITTHVLNQVTGKPAGPILVTLNFFSMDKRAVIDRSVLMQYQEISDPESGRINLWRNRLFEDSDFDSDTLIPGARPSGALVCELSFQTDDYWSSQGIKSFYPEVVVRFEVEIDEEGRIKGHYHVPVLLGPWGYTTYRGN